MKTHELFEHEDDRWYRRDHEHFGMRVGITGEEVNAIVSRIKTLMSPDGQDVQDSERNGWGIDGFAVIWTSPRHARTFPADVRLVLTRKDPRFDQTSEDGQNVAWFFKLAIQRAVKEVLGIHCKVNSVEDYFSNGMRYIDTEVGWTA